MSFHKKPLVFYRVCSIYAHRTIHALAMVWALGGGVLLMVIAGLTLCSILGRALLPLQGLLPLPGGGGPLPGVFELVEHGTALAVFAFLPWCSLKRTHVRIDAAVDALPHPGYRDAVRTVTLLIGDCFMLGLAGVMAVYGWRGLWEKAALCMTSVWQCEVTPILAIPVWYGYAVAAGALTLHAVVVVMALAQTLMRAGCLVCAKQCVKQPVANG